MTVKSKDFGGNKQLEEKTDSFKSANSFENYELKELFESMLLELKEIKKQLIKINK